MKQFIVAYISFFENDLQQYAIEAENMELAIAQTAYKYLGTNNTYYDLDSLQEDMVNCDAAISIYEIG